MKQSKVPAANREVPEAILSLISKGDKKSEQALVSRYWGRLYFLLQQRTQDPQLAADLAQDAFLIVIEKAREGAIENPKALTNFIKQVGVNLMIGHYRKEKRRVTDSHSQIDIHIPDDSPSLFQQLQSEELLAIVSQLLNELNVDRDRQILRNLYVYHKDKKEICQELALSPEHFDRVLQRARTRLRQLVRLKLGPKVNRDDERLFNTLGPLALVIQITSNLMNAHPSEQSLVNMVREFQPERHFYTYTLAENQFLLSKDGKQ